MDMTVAQVRSLQSIHTSFVAAEGRERALVLRSATQAKARDFQKLIGELYGDA